MIFFSHKTFADPVVKHTSAHLTSPEQRPRCWEGLGNGVQLRKQISAANCLSQKPDARWLRLFQQLV